MKIRIKFSKHGNIRFIGHLDMMRYFQKCMRRADIPIKYSDGFSPHQIMSFAAPLGLGVESDAEYMDIEITEEIGRDEAMKRLNAVMCEGVRVLDWKIMPDNSKTAMSQMNSADYLVTCRKADMSTINSQEIAAQESSMQENSMRGNLTWETLTQEILIREVLDKDKILVEKENKKTGECKLIDIKPMIYDINKTDDGVFMHIAQGSNANLKPSVVMEYLGIKYDRIIRKEIYDINGLTL